jgi:cytochrome d ubiquinol oxidase subunit II
VGIDTSIIWFTIIVFSTLMYIVMDGFDLGIGILFPFNKDAAERDMMVNTVAPVWDGNETWLVLGGAALYGAFPLAYAVILDALSVPLTLMLIGNRSAPSVLGQVLYRGLVPGDLQPGRGAGHLYQRF